MLSTVYILMLNLRRMYQFNLFTAQDFALLVQFSIHWTYFNPEFEDNVSVNLFAAQDFALLVQFSSQDSFKNRWSLPALKMPILKTSSQIRIHNTPPPPAPFSKNGISSGSPKCRSNSFSPLFIFCYEIWNNLISNKKEIKKRYPVKCCYHWHRFDQGQELRPVIFICFAHRCGALDWVRDWWGGWFSWWLRWWGCWFR